MEARRNLLCPWTSHSESRILRLYRNLLISCSLLETSKYANAEIHCGDRVGDVRKAVLGTGYDGLREILGSDMKVYFP